MIQFAPKEQQIEGLKAVLARVPFSVFIRAVHNLSRHHVLTRAQASKRIKYARHILGISYREYWDTFKRG